jgi:hypothetical protein
MPVFRKKPVVVTAHQWFQNGDHPEDGPADREGKVVRYFRRPEPEYAGDNIHGSCGDPWNDHGWIDTLEGGHTVCPGDWIIRGVKGEFYPCKPDIFAETYERESDGEFRPADALNKLHTVDDTRTTAKRLAAYRDELLAAGFNEEQVREFVQTAAPLPDDLVIQADLDTEPAVGEVLVRFVPQIDPDEIERVVKQSQAFASRATQR